MDNASKYKAGTLAERWYRAGVHDGSLCLRGAFDGEPLCHENIVAYNDGLRDGDKLAQLNPPIIGEIPGDDDASVDWDEYASWDTDLNYAQEMPEKF